MELLPRAAKLTAWRLPLRRWQEDALAAWHAHQPAQALVVATPGAGKTRFAARLAHALLSEGRIARILVVVPREHLKRQFASALAGVGIDLEPQFENAEGTLASDMHGAVLTYQQVAFAPGIYARLARVPSLVVLDEIHHAGDQATWGQALRDAFAHAAFRLALSGTPFRSDGTAIPFVRYRSGLSQPDFAYGYKDALRDAVCRPLVFPLQGGYAEWIGRDGQTHSASFEAALRSRVRESERLRTALTQEAWLGDVIERAHAKLLEIRKTGHSDAGGLVVAMNQDHARFVSALIEERTGTRATLVVSDEDGASRRISAFARSRDPWIVAVHMISEGVDIPRLRVGIFATNVNTEMYFRQFCGRFVRAQHHAGEQHAFVYLPDDPRLRALASHVTSEVRAYLKDRLSLDDLALAQRRLTEKNDAETLFAGISARLEDERVVDYGPLFNPAALLAASHNESALPSPDLDEPVESKSERKEAVRRALQALVASASVRFRVSHRSIHGTLNRRFGGPIARATHENLMERRAAVLRWLERDRYDGLP